jgi:ABC-type transport system substrate-binding protein
VIPLYDADGAAIAYRKGSPYSLLNGFYNPDAEPLWDQIMHETEQNKRVELMRKAHAFLLQDNAWPMLYYVVKHYPVDNRIHNYHMPLTPFTNRKHEHLWCDPKC